MAGRLAGWCAEAAEVKQLTALGLENRTPIAALFKRPAWLVTWSIYDPPSQAELSDDPYE